MTEVKKSNWTTMAAIAMLMGLFIVFVAPGLFDTTMDTLIMKQSKQATALNAGHLSRFYVGSIYSGIEMLVGLALIAVSIALYKGKNGLGQPQWHCSPSPRWLMVISAWAGWKILRNSHPLISPFS